MNPTEYMQELKNEIMSRKDSGTSVIFRDERKNNGVLLHACTVRENGAEIAPTVYLEPYYDSYLEGTTIRESADNILKFSKMRFPGKEMNPGFWKDYSAVRKRFGLKLIGFDSNREFLEEVPYMRRADMAVTVYYMMPEAVMPGGTITVRRRDLAVWDTDIKTLFSDALASCIRLLPPVFKGMGEIIGVPETDPGDSMYVLTNERTVYGAAAALYPNLLEAISERLGSSFYILPSSIHEMILLPDAGEDPGELKQIVTQINRTEVPREDVLTDSVYYYSPGDATFHRVC